MKIAYFTDTFYPEINGVTNTLSYLTNYLKTKGIESMFFAPDYENSKQEEDESNIFRFRGLKLNIAPESRLAFPTYLFNKEKIEKFNPDIVHVTTQLGIGRLGIKYAEEFKIPIVMSYHTNFDRYLKYYNLEYLDNIIWNYTRKFYSKSELTLCPSQDTVKDLENKGFNNLGIWSRGVDTTKFT